MIDGYNFHEMEAMKYFAPPSSWTEEKKHQNAQNKIWSGDWFGAEKKDGYFAKIVKENGKVSVYGRQRNVNKVFVDKSEWVPQFNVFFSTLPDNTCVLGEIYFPNQPGSRNVTTVMQCLKEKALARQQTGEKLHLYIFDILAWNGTSLLDKPFERRMDFIRWLANDTNDPYVSVAEYFNGDILWQTLQQILSDGGEGIVILNKNGKYEPGKRPSQTTLKIKKELRDTIDCFFTGRYSLPTKEYTGSEIVTWKYWENTRTGEKMEGEFYKNYYLGEPLQPVTKPWFYGWAGSMEIGVLVEAPNATVCAAGYDGYQIESIGSLSGLTDEIKSNPTAYAMRPIEVTAMELSVDDTHTIRLRHGKFIGFRDDLTPLDCLKSKINI